MSNQKHVKIKWDEHYNLGVEEIDREHKKLFSILDKIMVLVQNEEEGKIQHACREGVKFFKNYTITHFEHEENFMLSISYGKYQRHKKIHDDLKNNLLPAMEEELEANNYNEEAVRHFLGVCTAWLITHIEAEDQAIVNHQVDSYMKMEIGSQEIVSEEVLVDMIKEMFELDIHPISHHYNGWDFGKAIFHELTFVGEAHDVTQLMFIMEQRLIFSLASKRLGVEYKRVDSSLMTVVKEILHDLGKRISDSMGIKGQGKSRSGVMLSTNEVEEIFLKKRILYSTLFKTELGNFACSVYKR